MLTDKACKNAKPKAKPYKLTDFGRLYLFVTPTAKLWRMAYNFGGKEKTLSFGAYDNGMSLADARQKRDDAKALITEGIDPASQKKDSKRPKLGDLTFRTVGAEWFEAKVVGEKKSASTVKSQKLYLRKLNEAIGHMEIGKIEPLDLLYAVRAAQKKGRHETAARMRSVASRVFRFGIPFGYCKFDPAAALTYSMTKPQTTPRPALVEPSAFGDLLADLMKYDGHNGNVVGRALRLLALVVTRPGIEFRLAKWTEIDFDRARWTIPKARMKEREGNHIVPLSRQAIAMLLKLRNITGNRAYVFSLNRDEPISMNVLNAALRSLGYSTKTKHCCHGFRSSFSTILNQEYRADGEKVWHSDVIEMQLAHIEGSTRSIYNRTGPESLMPQRIKLMQHWADRCDAMREGDNVVPMIRPKRQAA
jgi:integrase